jgi:GNAT superfamily N-acetyltransferase
VSPPVIDRALLDGVLDASPLPHGYRFELLRPDDIGALIAHLDRWYPDVGVGAASGFLRRGFYEREVLLPDAPARNFIVVVVKHGERIAGMIACEREPEALALYGRLAVVAPEHRGAGLGLHAIAAVERIGRALGMGLIYGMATLKIPHTQQAFERLGWRLIGIVPGYDREFVGAGAVRRIYEAVYAKVLAAGHELQHPDPRHMTPRTRQLFELLFVSAELASESPQGGPTRCASDDRCSNTGGSTPMPPT